MPHQCPAGMEAPESALKSESRVKVPEGLTLTKDPQKPWSIFGDVYWI